MTVCLSGERDDDRFRRETERRVASLAGSLVARREGRDTSALALLLAAELSRPTFRDGMLGVLAAGGVRSPGASTPTGMVPKSAAVLGRRYGDIPWMHLARALPAGTFERLKYFGLCMATRCRRRVDVRNIVHLATAEKLAEAETRGVPVRPSAACLLPVLYCSPAHVTGSCVKLSACSRDIVRQRAEASMRYASGLLFDVNGDRGLVLERKSSVAYQNHFFRREFGELWPSAHETVRRSRRLTAFAEAIRREPASTLEHVGEFVRANDFSIVGACLFECAYEHLTRRLGSVARANQVLERFDPPIAKLWATRAAAWTPESLLDLFQAEDRLDGERGYRAFAEEVERTFGYRLGAYLGDNADQAEACAYNDAVHERVHAIRAALGRKGDDAPAEDDARLLHAYAAAKRALGVDCVSVVEAHDAGCWLEALLPVPRDEVMFCPLLHEATRVTTRLIALRGDGSAQCGRTASPRYRLA